MRLALIVALGWALGAAPESAAQGGEMSGESFRDRPDGPEMIALPGGEFVMGSPEDEIGRDEDEGPQRVVRIAPFAIGKYPITFDEWDACLADGGCGGYRPPDQGWGRGDRPAINVSWDDAQAYIAWINSNVPGAPYRLPSEAEWEYAARAGTTTPFWWGEGIDTDQANYDGTYTYAVGDPQGANLEKTLPVKSFAPNPFGLYQMHGNVWEWVQDCWNDSYVDAPRDGAPWMTGDCAGAPLRGGTWYYGPEEARSAYRYTQLRDARFDVIGFRLARSAPAPE